MAAGLTPEEVQEFDRLKCELAEDRIEKHACGVLLALCNLSPKGEAVGISSLLERIQRPGLQVVEQDVLMSLLAPLARLGLVSFGDNESSVSPSPHSQKFVDYALPIHERD